MGQYHVIVNLDKGEYLHPHRVGDGLKWAEQADSEEGTMAALWGAITCPEPRGGGDPIAHLWTGRWHGDRVVMVGDYAEDADRPDVPQWSALYHRCASPGDFAEWIDAERTDSARDPAWIEAVRKAGPLMDVSDIARDFLAAQFDLRFLGTGWIERQRNVGNAPRAALAPDMVIGG